MLKSSGIPLNRRWFEQHLPHRGRMCLLDEVREWDGGSIRCLSNTHRVADHPLRAHGRLGAACGVEYAAQAMAVHGALLKRSTGTQQPNSHQSFPASPRGLLASVRGLLLAVERLDQIESALSIHCQCLQSDPRTAVYQFTLHGDGRLLLSGRAAVVFVHAPVSA